MHDWSSPEHEIGVCILYRSIIFRLDDIFYLNGLCIVLRSKQLI